MIVVDEEEWRIARQVALRARRHYPVDPEDVEQELLTWLLENDEEVKTWRDSEYWLRNVYRALWRRARALGETEKAHAGGYDVSDVQWYSTRQLRALLPYALTRTIRTTGVQESVSGSSERNNAETMMLDVRIAFGELDEADRHLLFDYIVAGLSSETLAMRAGVKVTTIRKKVSRALRRLQTLLGGTKPW